jgi:hypothetical protein
LIFEVDVSCFDRRGFSIGLADFILCDIERENGSPIISYTDCMTFLILNALYNVRGVYFELLIGTRLEKSACQLAVLTSMRVPVM